MKGAKGIAGRTGLYGVAQGGPVLAIATCQTRTQAIYTFSSVAPVVMAMTSDLDLSLTMPSGVVKNLLEWDIYGEQDDASCNSFLVYRKVDAGAFILLPESRVGTDYWSAITRVARTNSTGYAALTTSITIDDTNPPAAGSVVTYRLYTNNIRIDAAGAFYLNRCISSAGASLYLAGVSHGKLTCI